MTQQHEKILPLLLFRAALSLLLGYWALISLRLSVAPMQPDGLFFIVAVNIILISTLVLARLRLWVTFATYFFIVGIMFLVIARAYLAGGSDSPVLVILILAPISATFLLGRGVGLVFAVLVAVTLFIFIGLRVSGHEFPDLLMNSQQQGIIQSAVVIFVMLVTTWISWLYTRNNETLTMELLDQTRRDHLTDVPNRRAFDVALEREIKIAKRQNHHLTLFMIDIDNFKNFNDLYGHHEGDQCLIRVANIVQSCLRRPGDMVARYGGEEFAVILPDTEIEQALLLAETMRHAVLGLNTAHEESSQGVVTITLGVSDLSLDGDMQADELISLADDALYEGKAAGRNQVVAKNNN